jgi:hypothetical protein
MNILGLIKKLEEVKSQGFDSFLLDEEPIIEPEHLKSFGVLIIPEDTEEGRHYIVKKVDKKALVLEVIRGYLLNYDTIAVIYVDGRKKCEYLTSNGNRCAIGKMLKDESFDVMKKLQSIEDYGDVYDLREHLIDANIDLYSLMQQKYKVFTMLELNNIQMFHDTLTIKNDKLLVNLVYLRHFGITEQDLKNINLDICVIQKV